MGIKKSMTGVAWQMHKKEYQPKFYQKQCKNCIHYDEHTCKKNGIRISYNNGDICKAFQNIHVKSKSKEKNIRDVFLLYPMYRCEDVEPHFPIGKSHSPLGDINIHFIRLPFVFENDTDRVSKQLTDVIKKIFGLEESVIVKYNFRPKQTLSIVAEKTSEYGEKN